jgi:hypothetical protein
MTHQQPVTGEYDLICVRCQIINKVTLNQTQTNFTCFKCKNENIAFLARIRSKSQKSQTTDINLGRGIYLPFNTQRFDIRVYTFEGEELISTNTMGIAPKLVVFHSGDTIIIVLDAYDRGKNSFFINATIGTYHKLGKPSRLPVHFLKPEKTEGESGCIKPLVITASIYGVLFAFFALCVSLLVFFSISSRNQSSLVVKTPTISFSTEDSIKQPSLSTEKFPIIIPQKKFQILFKIESVQVDENSLTLFISVKRLGTDVLKWYGDKENLDRIFVQSTDKIYSAIEVGGIFLDEVTVLQPDKEYQGWIKFGTSEQSNFTFHYPDMEPGFIQLSE